MAELIPTFPFWTNGFSLESESQDRRVIAVDPGLEGAIAYMDEDLACVGDMPVKMWHSGTRYVVDFEAVRLRLVEASHCVLEDVHPTPKMSSASGFRMGYSVCAVECAMMARQLPILRVSAQKWKRYYDLIGKGKDGSLDLARELFPEFRDTALKRKKDDGRAEALLLAKYGMEHTEW